MEAPQAATKARMSNNGSAGEGFPRGICGDSNGGGGSASRVGESVPNGGMLSGNPVAVALMNLASAIVRAGDDQPGDSWLSEVTPGRKRVLAQAPGGQERTA